MSETISNFDIVTSVEDTNNSINNKTLVTNNYNYNVFISADSNRNNILNNTGMIYLNGYYQNITINGPKYIYLSCSFKNNFIVNTSSNQDLYIMGSLTSLRNHFVYLPYTNMEFVSVSLDSSITNGKFQVFLPNDTSQNNTEGLNGKIYYTKVPYPGVLSLPKAQNPRNQVGIRSNFI